MPRTTSFLLASALLTSAGAAGAADRSESVKLRPGGHAVSCSGSVDGHDTASYKLHAAKSETLKINSNSTRGSCKFDPTRPGWERRCSFGVAPASTFAGTLPESGEYPVEIKQEPAGHELCAFDLRARLRD